MHVITFINEKGGVGKTTLSLTLATGLAIKGQRVLLIDGDSQGHVSVAMGTKPTDGLFRLLGQEAKWADVLISPDPTTWLGDPAGGGSLWVLPGNSTTVAIAQAIEDAGLLRERLEDLQDHVDVVVIDTAPQLGLMHTVFYLATDSLVHPAQCESFALEGLGQTSKHTRRMNRDRSSYGLPSANLVGVIPNMHEAQTAAHQKGMKYLLDTYGTGNVLSPLGARTAWREAAINKRSIFTNSPGSQAEAEAWTMVHEVADRIFE
jgi:chromosome partitioning protein